MYLLVEFTDEKCLAVIPDNWRHGSKCALWPDTPNPTKMVQRKQTPGDSWKAYPIRELYQNVSYDKVRGKMRKAEEDSDIATTAVSDSESDQEEARRSKRRRREIHFPSSDEDTSTTNYNKLSKLPKPPKPVSDIRQPSTPTPDPITAVEFTHARDIRLFTVLEKIRGTQAKQQDMLETIYNELQGISNSLHVGPEISKGSLSEEISCLLPLNSHDDLKTLENRLSDKQIFSSLVSHLSMCGGKTTKDAVKRAMKRVLTSRLAVNFNWFGKKGKSAFGKLTLASALMRGIRGSRGEVTDAEMEVAVREWLRTASDRDGDRKRRAAASCQSESALSAIS